MHYKAETIEEELINSKLITDLLTELFIEKKRMNQQLTNIPSHILEIKRLFETNYERDYNLTSLALQFNRNKYTLTREFTFYIHCSPIHYLIHCRINRAKDLLWTSNYTISEIGRLVGMENTSYFIQQFKKETGFTPFAYRKKRAENIIHFTTANSSFLKNKRLL